MKNLFKLPVLVLGLILLLAGTTQKATAQDYDVSLQTFYDELSPYGTWIQDREYGYVWRPDVDQRDFRPYYTDGRWVMTEYGNTWVSDYDWGWAPFHYGRWVNNRYNEWVWIPDTVWGPAWVTWRSGGGYFGWAPLGPGININVNIGGGGYYDIPHSWWVFVPQRNIYYDRFPRYRGYGNVNIFQQTTIINYVGQRNKHTYFTGPRRDDIRRATNRDVTVYNVNRSNRAGRSTISNNTVNIYNPRSNRNSDNNSNRTPAPRTVVPESTYSNNRNVVNRDGKANTRNNAESRSSRTAVERGTTRTETSATPRAERSRERVLQGEQRTMEQQGNVPARTQRTQRAEQLQGQERERQQQAATRAQAERSQRVQEMQAQQQERSRQQQVQQQQQAQERSRQQQQSAPRPQVQQQNNESRGGGEASGGSRSSRSNRG
ncbi:DUF6600 domain-containing protein [Pedobacter sp.]|uniref:DUF6600 domain-containing protein n=1 Tax=Pedobacter sp. TaxID=1411316 RepID=UPI003D7F1FFD